MLLARTSRASGDQRSVRCPASNMQKPRSAAGLPGLVTLDGGLVSGAELCGSCTMGHHGRGRVPPPVLSGHYVIDVVRRLGPLC